MSEIVAVASVAYNMAGEELDRPSYLKSLVIQNILSGTKTSMSDSLTAGYLHGPGLQLKSFYKWAARPENYDKVGLPTGRLESNGTADHLKVAAEIPHADGITIKVRSTSVGYADAKYWAERFMLASHASQYDQNWTFEYKRNTNEIKIVMPSGTIYTFTATNFNYTSRYLYVYYSKHNNSTGEEGDTQVYIYKLGSGNADLDDVVEDHTSYGEFFPFIPLRLDNEFISEDHLSNVWEQTQKAYKKATGGKLEKLIVELKDNEDLDDIDHAYVTFGVSLNVVENSCKKYIYKFFETLQATQIGGADAHQVWRDKMKAGDLGNKTWNAWVAMGRIGPEPERPSYPSRPTNTIRIAGSGEISDHYDVRINWNYINDGTGSGRGKAGAKRGDLWFTKSEIVIGQNMTLIQVGFQEYVEYATDIKVSKLRLHWQRTNNSYTWIDIVGANYQNCIYKGKSVYIDAADALDDPNESGFIIPIHYDTWRAMSLVDTSQMSTACVFAVFNCYEARKKRWYESGIFKIFLVIVIAVVSVLFTGGAGIGLLGAHLAVGTSLGLTGMAAAILGSVVNALAAMVLTTIISKMAEGIGAFGQLLSAILMIAIGSAVSAFQNSGLASINWSDFLRVDNLLKLTNAVGNTIVGLVQEDTLGIQQEWEDFQENADAQATKIHEAYLKQFGYGGAIIYPNMFVDQASDLIVESSDTFLTRTLMTGSEIAEMSRELLYDFPSLTLKLPDAFT